MTPGLLRTLPAMMLVSSISPVAAEERSHASFAPDREVSLEEVLVYAERHSPSLALSVKRQGYAAAERVGAQPLLRQNPTLEFSIGPRFDGESNRDFDFLATLSQPLEIAGERRARLTVASRLDQRLEAETGFARWELRRAVTHAYRKAQVARERVRIAAHMVTFAKDMLRISQRRLGAGDTSIVTVRVAETDLAQALQAEITEKREYRTEQIHLSELTGWSIEAPPRLTDGLKTPRPVPSLTAVIAAASNRHPEINARRATVAEAKARGELARREAWPALAVGVQAAREGSAGSPANYIIQGNLGLSLPFWQRNQAERVRRKVDQEVALADESATAWAVRARIIRAHTELAAAAERLALFTAKMTPQLEDNLKLLRRGFEAGEIPLLDVSISRERFLGVQLAALAAHTDYYQALTELEFAIGVELPVATPASTTGALP